jgi:predicted outer membrane protein
VKIVGFTPFHVNTEAAIDKWNLLQLETSLPKNMTSARIDVLWNSVFSLKNHQGQTKYPLVSKIVKAALCMSHGNADVGRDFSWSGRIMTEEKSSMKVKMLNARLIVSDALKKFENRPEIVPITRELLNLGRNACQSYKLYLEAERSRQAEVESKRKEEEEEKKRMLSEKKTIEHLEKDLIEKKSVEKEKRQVAERLLQEANEKLKKAIDAKDFVEISLAQSMIEALSWKMREEDVAAREVERIQSRVNK